MSLKAVQWALEKRVGNGILKATLVCAACVCAEDDSCSRSALVSETGLKPETVLRHLRLLQFLSLLHFDDKRVHLRVGA